jgi:hypothetical protein
MTSTDPTSKDVTSTNRSERGLTDELFNAEAACPWKGLATYGPSERSMFFGRDRAARKLTHLVSSTSLCGVIGSSGSGKSSLVLAGLGSESLTSTVSLRPGARPQEALSLALTRLQRGNRSLLIVDQLEEVLSHCDEESSRRTFLSDLCDLAESNQSNVIVTLRSDYYGALAPYSRFADSLSQAHVLLSSPTEEEIRRIITQPAAAAGVILEPGLEDEIVDDVVGEPGILPLLSHALAETWAHREGQTMTTKIYRETGGVRGAIARTAEHAWQGLPENERSAARAILLQLASRTASQFDSGQRVPVSALAPIGNEPSERALRAIVNARLVVIDGGNAEIAHEAVFREWPRLKRWLVEERDSLRRLSHLRESSKLWKGSGYDPSMLLRGTALEEARDLVANDTIGLDGDAKDYVGAATAALSEESLLRNREISSVRRTNRILRGTLIGAAVAIVVLSIALFLQRRQSHPSTHAVGSTLTAGKHLGKGSNLTAGNHLGKGSDLGAGNLAAGSVMASTNPRAQQTVQPNETGQR